MQGASVSERGADSRNQPRLLDSNRDSPGSATGDRVLVSMATYNERDNLASLVGDILQVLPAAHVLVIDDHSPDGTGRLADELAAADPRVHVLHRAGKLGLGTAIVAGMRFAMEHNYDLFVNLDADYSHRPRYLPALLAGMAGHDVMIGSRYIPGGGTVNWPASRRLMSWGVNALVRLLLRIPARDASGGYRCYRVAKLGDAGLDGLLSYGYSFLEEVLYRLSRAGARIGETPIVFEDRRAGASKVNYWEVARSLAILCWLGVRATLGVDRTFDRRFDGNGACRRSTTCRPGA
jgi:dolichol-phosphate mannosyltransferase